MVFKPYFLKDCFRTYTCPVNQSTIFLAENRGLHKKHSERRIFSSGKLFSIYRECAKECIDPYYGTSGLLYIWKYFSITGINFAQMTFLGNPELCVLKPVLSIWQVPSSGLTKTDLGIVILLIISPKTIEKDTTTVRKLGILAEN